MSDRADAHYTPGWVADRVASHAASLARSDAPHVADYAAGDGALLRAVSKVLPQALVTATDIDPAAVARLATVESTWRVGRCDLLSARSRAGSPHLGPRSKPADLVVLNPPFSHRGGTYLPVLSGLFRASPAMAFVSHALEQLADKGSAVVLVPSGSLSTQKDELLWAHLRRAAAVQVVDELGRTTFRGEHAVVSLVVLRGVSKAALHSVDKPAQPSREPVLASANAQVRLIRGTQQMHTIVSDPHGLPLAHSTHLVGGKLRSGPLVVATGRTIEGHAVLLPRVGAPRREKVGLRPSGGKLVLSDCVIALRGQSKATTLRLRKDLLDSWDDLAALYGGSCAPYLTVRDLRDHVEKLGYSVELSGRDS